MPPHAVRPAAAASAPSPPRHLERRGFCHFPCGQGNAPPERLSWKKNWKISRRSATSARATRRCPAPSCLQRGFDFLRGPAGGIPSFSSERSARAGDRDGQPNVGLRAGGGAGRRAAGRRGRRRYRTGAVRPCRSLAHHLVVVVGGLQGADHGAFFVSKTPTLGAQRVMSEFVFRCSTGGLDHQSAPGPPAPGPASRSAVGHPGALRPAGEPDARSDHEPKAASFGRGGGPGGLTGRGRGSRRPPRHPLA